MQNQSRPQTSEPDHGAAPAFAALVADLLNSDEIRRLLADVGRQWVRDWSDHNRLKQILGKPAAWAISKSLYPSNVKPLAGCFEKPEHIESLASQTSPILQGLRTLLLSAVDTVDKLSTERKKALFSRLLTGAGGASGGSLLAGLARIAEDIYKEDPFFFSARLVPLLDQSLGRTDFGELKSLLDAAKEDLGALVREAVGLLFEYPAKLTALLAVVPDGIHLTLSALHDLLGQANGLPPDILTDLLLTIFRQVDAALIGQSLNRANELIRQFHTGSTLIGEMDAPRFSKDLKDKLREMAAQIDPVLAVKARSALIDGRETVIRVLIDTAQDQPELLNLWFKQLAASRNADIRLFKHKIEVIENLPADEAVEALSAGLSSWNAYDLAETLNSLGRLANRIGRLKPELFKTLVTEFVHTLDLYELEESLAWLSRDLGRALRPAFRRLAPPLIHELCAFFEPSEPGEEDDGCNAAMDEARQRLRRLLGGEETPP